MFVLTHDDVSAQKKRMSLSPLPAGKSSTTDVSDLIQKAIDSLSDKGGGSLLLQAGTFLIKYPVFVKNNVRVYGVGQKTRIKANISASEGRCAFVVGNSYEWNLEKSQEYRKKRARGWLSNDKFKDIRTEEGLNLVTTDSRVVARNAAVENLLIEFDYTGCGSNWGGYGIQFANAANCSASNIWTINACQAVGIGSDTGPSTGSCVNVTCRGIHVLAPDPVRTYYAIGFISSSNNCEITDSDSKVEMTAGSKDGSLIAMNFAKNCVIRNIDGVVGNTITSEGVLLNNSYGCVVENVRVRKARKGIVTSFTDFDLLKKNGNARSRFSGIQISDCESAIYATSKFTIFEDIDITGCKKAISYNINATNNEFRGFGYWKGISKEDSSWLSSHNSFSVSK